MTGHETRPDSRDAIVSAARVLFTDRGYSAVTIRDIAAAAGVSPALVIKLHGSKAELFSLAGPATVPLVDIDLPRDSVGRALVNRLLQRRESGEPEMWAGISQLVRESPQPEATRDEFVESRLAGIGELIGDRTPDRRHAAAVICHLIGLADGLRTLELLPAAQYPREQLLEMFAPVIQRHVDACDPS